MFSFSSLSTFNCIFLIESNNKEMHLSLKWSLRENDTPLIKSFTQKSPSSTGYTEFSQTLHPSKFIRD